MEAWGKAAVMFTLVGIGGEAFMAGRSKEAGKVHVEDRIPDHQRLERPLYTDSTTSTAHTIQWRLGQNGITVTQFRDGRIQAIVVGSVSSVTLPNI